MTWGLASVNGVTLVFYFQDHVVTTRTYVLPENNVPSHNSLYIAHWLLVSQLPSLAFKGRIVTAEETSYSLESREPVGSSEWAGLHR